MIRTPSPSRLFLAALALAAALPALSGETPDAIRADLRERRAAAGKSYAETATRAADLALEEARQMQAKAKKTGNVTAQAVAKTALQIAGDARAAIAKGESPALPDNVRRELRDWLAGFRKRLDDAASSREAAMKALEAEALARLAAVLRDAGETIPDEESLRALLDHAPAADGAAAAEGAAPDAGGTADANGDGASGEDSGIPPAVSGETASWTPVAHVTVAVSDMEMVVIPVAGIARPDERRTTNPMTGQEYTVRVDPVHELVVAGKPPAFRAVPENGRPVEVVTWPNARNGWSIEIRARPDPRGDGTLRFRLDAGAEGAEFQPIAGAPAPGGSGGDSSDAAAGGGAAADTAAAGAETVHVRFESDPGGATVSVDGRMIACQGRARTTPFEADLPALPAKEIRFRKRGRLDAVYRDVALREGTLRANLRPDPAVIDRKVAVRANAPDWQPSGIRVKKGQAIEIEAMGKWSCGGKAKADAAGYANDDRDFAYYVDPKKYPRRIVGENVGCLLVRVAPDGAPVAFHGLHATFVADADGMLAFDVNEVPSARRDNGGTLSVRVVFTP